MTSPKHRASMREGPLAALFRKTEEGEAPAGEESERGGAQEALSRETRSQERAEESAEDARPHAASPKERGDESAEDVRAHAASPRERGDVSVEDARAHVASPKERLLQAFSSEIPANVMERPRPATSAGQMREVQAREQPLPTPADGPAGHPLIRVVGVGGAGTNAVNRMVEAQVPGVEFVAVNTDLQSLQQSSADVTVHIGAELTRGLGSGSDANVGRQAAMDDYDSVKALLKGSDMIFIAAGSGGGTGTGAAPIVARIAQEVGALTVAIVTKPFGFEGSRRAEQAQRGIEVLAEEVDTLIVVPNNRLLSILDKQTSMVEAFRVADDVLRQGVQGISDLVTLPGLINLDFADVRTIMSDAGNALLGIGMGVGESRAIYAAMQAASSPLLETSMEGARSILLSITGGADLSLWEVNEAAKAVSEAAHPDANIIFGAMVDEKLDGEVWVTVVATGYGEHDAIRRLREPAGEPRVTRNREPRITDRRGGRERRRPLAVDEYDIPEFVPRV